MSSRPLSFGESLTCGVLDLLGPLVPEASPEESEAHRWAVHMDVVDMMLAEKRGVVS